MATVSKTFTGTGTAGTMPLRTGEYIDYAATVAVAFTGLLRLEYSKDGGQTWQLIRSSSGVTTTYSGTFRNVELDGQTVLVRWRCLSFTSGSAVCTVAEQAEPKMGTQLYDQDGNLVFEVVEGGIKMAMALEVLGALAASGGVSLGAALTALSTLTPAANKAPYFTSASAAALADITAFARTILDDANAAGVQATLGLTPGTDVQTQDAELQAIAGLVSAANKLPYFTGAGTASLADLTAAARGLLDDADVATMRTTLGVAADPGRRAINILRVAANVASAETVVIGGDTYEIEIVNTDSTDDTAGGSWNNVTNPLTVTIAAGTYPALAGTLAAGDLIRIENEILRVTGVVGDDVTFARGTSGTTIAVHADANSIYVGDGIVAGIAVGLVATLTPAAFVPALVADINSEGTEAVTGLRISDNEMILQADAVGAVTLACTETLAGADNVWAAANMYGGLAQGLRKFAIQRRVPNATEVALGNMHFSFDFTPTFVQVLVAPTATPGAMAAWDGTWTINGGLVTADNAGAVDWAVTDDVVVIAWA